MSPTKITQIFSQLLLIGIFIPMSIGNAIASEILTVEVSAVDLQPEQSADSAEAKLPQISGINKILNPDLSSGRSHLYLAQRKKQIKKKRIEKGFIKNEPQINNNQNNNQPQIQTEPSNIRSQIQNTQPQIQNTQPNTQPQIQNRLTTQTQSQNSDNNSQSKRSRFYVSGGTGLFSQNLGFTETNTGGSKIGTSSLNLNLGADSGGSLAFGFKSSSFWRTELELVASSTKPVDTNLAQIAAMFNIYYDISTGSKFTPYVAAGIGYSISSINAANSPGGLAYQLKAGAEYEIIDNISLYLQYRYLKGSEAKDSRPDGLNNIKTLTITPSSNSIEFGSRFSF